MLAKVRSIEGSLNPRGGGAVGFVIMAFAAFGLTTRVFRLNQKESRHEFREITTELRDATEVQQVSIDEMVSSVVIEQMNPQ